MSNIQKHVFKNGMTIKDLKLLIKDWPEVNPDTGESCEVWLDHNGLSNQVKVVMPLNLRSTCRGSHYADIIFGER